MELTQIGKYKIHGLIGHGAMGHVYGAHDDVLNRRVAIKTIPATLASDDELRKRFHREAQAAARLNHPNIITVYDYGEEKGTIYIAMELLEGTDLKEFASSGALRSLGAKLRIMEQVCDGLAFAHSKGVIHRDIKPANIFVQSTGQVKIMDFGLARVDSGDLSKAGMVVGTPNYMSPEQVLGDVIDARSDIFSLGAVFYELLSNKKPFDADSVHSILFQVVHKQVTPLDQLVPELPRIVVEVVEKALAKDRADRFQNAGEFREALRYVEHALASGRAQEARLSTASDPTMMSLRSGSMPRPSFPGPAPAPTGSVAGTGALAVRPVPKPSPASDRKMKPAAREAARDRVRPPSSRTLPPLSAPRKRSAWPTIFVLLLLAGGGGGGAWWWFVLKDRPGPAVPGAPQQTAQVGALTHALVATQLELARRDLEDKEYKSALKRVGDVLRLDPRNRDAVSIRKDAQGRVDEIESAATTARQAVEAGDTERASAALSSVMALDPKHPVVAAVSEKLQGSFRRQAEEARQLSDRSRGEAERSKAGSSETFSQAASAAREAEALFRKSEYASAARGFLEARDGYDRARRAVVSPAVAAPASGTGEPETAKVPAGPAASAPPTAAPSVPRAETTAAPSARRPFTAGSTIVQSARSAGAGVAGFESADVAVKKAPDVQGKIEFEVEPAAVRGGDRYAIGIVFTNLGKKEFKPKELVVTVQQNGRTSARTLAPPARAISPQSPVKLTEVGGTWEDGVESWSLEVVLTSDKGDSCRSQLIWR